MGALRCEINQNSLVMAVEHRYLGSKLSVWFTVHCRCFDRMVYPTQTR